MEQSSWRTRHSTTKLEDRNGNCRAQRRPTHYRKPSTLNGYRSMINKYLLPNFGERLLTDIGPGDLTSFFERARTCKRKKYLLNLYALLRVMFEVAVENGRVERSPVRKKLHRPSTDAGSMTRKPALSSEESTLRSNEGSWD